MADNAADLWAAVVEYDVLLQQVAPMMAATDDAGAGHSRQYRRTERNLDDFLIIPVAGGESEDGDEDEEEATEVTTPEQFQKFQDVLHTLLNGGDVIAVIYAGQSEGEPSEGEGTPGDLKDEQKPPPSPPAPAKSN